MTQKEIMQSIAITSGIAGIDEFMETLIILFIIHTFYIQRINSLKYLMNVNMEWVNLIQKKVSLFQKHLNISLTFNTMVLL